MDLDSADRNSASLYYLKCALWCQSLVLGDVLINHKASSLLQVVVVPIELISDMDIGCCLPPYIFMRHRDMLSCDNAQEYIWSFLY